MAWWVWMLLGWAVVSTVAAFWLGAAAAGARRRERRPEAQPVSDDVGQRRREAA